MNQFSTKADLMHDKTAFYKTEKAVNAYRKDLPSFDTLWQTDNSKSWQIIQTATQKVNDRYKYLMFGIIAIWLVLLFIVMSQLPGVKTALQSYNNLSEFEKHTTGRIGRLIQLVSHFGISEIAALIIFIVIIAIVSTYYGKWMMKKVKQEIEKNIVVQ